MSSVFSLPDMGGHVKHGTATRPRGSTPRQRRTDPLSGWTLGAIRADLRQRQTAELLSWAEDISRVPLVLRHDAWWVLAGLALELGERCLTLQVADGAEPTEGVA